MLGDATYDFLTGPLGQDNPFPSAADAMYLAMYPLIAGGLLMLIRVTNPLGDKHAALDATVVTVAVGLLVWVYLAEPYVQDTTMTWPQKAVSIGYPLGDVLILAVLARLLIGGGRRTRALWLLSIGTVGLLGSDVVYGLIQLNGSWATGGVVDSGWSSLHRLGRGRPVPGHDPADRAGAAGRAAYLPPRLLVITMVPLAAPGLQLWNISQGTAHYVPITAVASAILFLLVALRLKGLVDAARHAAERENAMRRTGEDLVAASDPDTVYRVGATAIGAITGRSSRLQVATGSPLRLAFDSVHPEGPSEDDDLGTLVRRHEHELRRQQFVLTTADQCGPALATDMYPDAVVLLAAMVRGEEVSGLLMVRGQGVDRPEAIDPICALALQMMLALDSIELTERRSETHFRSLFQHAADIILVVDEQLRLRFSTPSAQSVLGWDPADNEARTVESVVVTGDAARARLLVGRVLAGEWRAGGGPDDEWRVLDRHGIVRQFEVSCAT